MANQLSDSKGPEFFDEKLYITQIQYDKKAYPLVTLGVLLNNYEPTAFRKYLLAEWIRQNYSGLVKNKDIDQVINRIETDKRSEFAELVTQKEKFTLLTDHSEFHLHVCQAIKNCHMMITSTYIKNSNLYDEKYLVPVLYVANMVLCDCRTDKERFMFIHKFLSSFTHSDLAFYLDKLKEVKTPQKIQKYLGELIRNIKKIITNYLASGKTFDQTNRNEIIVLAGYDEETDLTVEKFVSTDLVNFFAIEDTYLKFLENAIDKVREVVASSKTS